MSWGDDWFERTSAFVPCRETDESARDSDLRRVYQIPAGTVAVQAGRIHLAEIGAGMPKLFFDWR